MSGRDFVTRIGTSLLLAIAFFHATAVWALDREWRGPDEQDKLYAVSFIGGEGTERNFSDIILHLFDVEASSDRIAAVTFSRMLGWYGDDLSFEAEGMYAFHYGRQRYSEFGTAVYARWHRFPWNDYVKTIAALGLGPSYTAAYSKLEYGPNETSRSRVLNQLNLQTTFALPSNPDTALLFRLQHRSGILGAIRGVQDASNFLTVGLRQDF